ncbi:MAG: pyridoxamine kinase [Clostridia bacterium]|nr:pyridoxamine kinase [Clostridia bacterium]
MRVLAVNDISCIGKCSLSVTLPVLSACGVTCDVLPTALLSTHTGGFEGYTFRDLTGDIEGILAHWKTLGVSFDAVYSGYLGSEAQIEIVQKIKRDFLKKDGFFVVDPVMGDSGSLYAGFNDGYVEKMRALCREADYILPNLTEACYLADIPYPAANTDELLQKLRELCARPVVTGILEKENISIRYTNKEGVTQKYTSENVEGFFCGAGDVFASAFVGALARGKSEETAIRLAADFTSASIRRSAKEVADKRYGLNFEAEIFTFLKNLNG